MGAFDEIFGNEKQASKQTLEPWKVSPEFQKQRDQGRTQILQQELTDAQARLKAGDARAQGDIDALNRDLGREKVKQGNAAPSGDFLDQYFEQRTAPQAKPQRIEISGGQPAQKQQPQQQVTAPSERWTGARNRAGQPVTETGDIVTGALGGLARTIGGAAHGAATQLLGGAGDINQLIVNNIGSAFPNAPALPTTKRLQELSPIAPQSQEGKVAQELGQFIPVPGLKGGSKVANALGEQFAKKVAPVAKRVEPTMGAVTPEEAAQATQVLNAPKTAANQPVMAGVGAARAKHNPYGGLISGEEGARGAYPTVKLSKIRQDAPPKEQAVRQEILQDVLGNQTNGIRQGVLTGNEDMLRNEYTLAKKGDTPAAQIMKDQLAKEQTAISNYAQDRVNRTGANQNFANDYERGQAINDAFAGDEGVLGWFKQQESQLYKTAKDKVGDNPITTNNVDKLFSNQQFKSGLGLTGNENVVASAEKLINLAKTVGFEDEFGVFHPANSISAFDAVKKANNAGWTKDNAKVIRRINQAIDKDVATAGGGDLYKVADRMHQAQKTLFGSKGIKTLFGNIDPNGVQAGTAFDVIPQKLNSMPFDQWRHIYDTADQLSRGTFKVNGELIAVPEEIRVAAQAAKNEMKGTIARDIYSSGANKVGEWNSNASNKRMNFLDQKIKHAFDPEEIQAFHKLNYAGQLMPSHGYEGAALQTSRLERVSEKFPAAGGVVGGAVAGPKGAIVGQYLGEKSKGLFKNRSQRQAAERLQQQLEENFRKGRE